MTQTGETPIVFLADSIVASDVVNGRPGKTPSPPVIEEPPPVTAEPPPIIDVPIDPPVGYQPVSYQPVSPGRWRPPCWSCVTLLLAIVVGVTFGFVGYRTAHEGGRVSLTGVTPDYSIPYTPQKPDTTTTGGGALTFDGKVQMTLHFTCNNQSNQLTLPALLTIGPSRFFLDPDGVPPFEGKVGPGNAVTAPGQPGTVSGTLANGTMQNLTLTTPNFPCKGVFPMTLQLPTPLSATPTVITGPPLADSIDKPVLIDPTGLSGTGIDERDILWPLILGGSVLDVLGLLILSLLGRRAYREYRFLVEDLD
jgi:hypothetical protein